MRVPTPVTKRANVIESGSARKPSFTCSPPAGNHEKMSTVCERGSTSRRARSITTDHANASAISPVASHPAFGSPRRRPKSSRIAVPSAGSAGTIQTRSRRSPASTASALQEPHVVGGGAPPAAEDGDDDRQAHRNLGRRDDEREEHDRL